MSQIAFAPVTPPSRIGFTPSSFTTQTRLRRRPTRTNATPCAKRSNILNCNVLDAPSDQIPSDPELEADPDILDAVVPDTDLTERQRRAVNLENASLEIPVPPTPTVVEIPFAPGKILRLETGRLARQAAGAVLVRLGDTMVFCTACAETEPAPTVDFLPLRVDYAEKFSSMGKTSGSYVKREGRPSEREILVSRLIDRPLRPMFEDGYFNEVQVLANVFSYDGQFPAEALAICGAAAALHVSHIPLVEPVAGVRLAYIDGAFVVEPALDDMKRSHAELVVAGTRKGILMIEGSCDFLSTEVILDGIGMAHEAISKICDGLDQLRAKTGHMPKITDTLRTIPEDIALKMAALSTGIDEALAVVAKKQRDEIVKQVRDRVMAALKPSRDEEWQDPDGSAERLTALRLAWKELVSERMRRRILDTGIRPDGRDVYTVRPITIDQAPLPRAHGSALFTRGETQALAVTTLGGDDMAQRFETLEGEDAARFYLQYSFPPFSVGEVGRVGAPGRREVGHGKLAERALLAAIPSQEEFPYVLRVESNILESNGSSSMASVCGGCLALLEAGVPLKCSVAGVAMGLVVDKSGDVDAETGEVRAVVLTDILGLEDALGSCDAKFAGNRHGWSALQLDVKLRGISISLFGRILRQASQGRDHILDCMDEVMPSHNKELADSVPKVEVIQVATKRIGEVIGPGGRTIRSIIDRCGGEDEIRISIQNSGKVLIYSSDLEKIEKAKSLLSIFTIDLSVGSILTGTVTKILPFGVYVEIADGKEGWLHISELEHKRTNQVEDVCAVGDKIEVKLIELGRNGQLRLSRKACLPPRTFAIDGGVRDGNSSVPGSRTSISGSNGEQKQASPTTASEPSFGHDA